MLALRGLLGPWMSKGGRASSISLTGSYKGAWEPFPSGARELPPPEDLNQKGHNGESSQKTDSGPKLHIDLLCFNLICCLVQFSALL